jgi:hypothetical protein
MLLSFSRIGSADPTIESTPPIARDANGAETIEAFLTYLLLLAAPLTAAPPITPPSPALMAAGASIKFSSNGAENDLFSKLSDI